MNENCFPIGYCEEYIIDNEIWFVLIKQFQIKAICFNGWLIRTMWHIYIENCSFIEHETCLSRIQSNEIIDPPKDFWSSYFFDLQRYNVHILIQVANSAGMLERLRNHRAYQMKHQHGLMKQVVKSKAKHKAFWKFR